jgi:hypothetical protein
MSRCEVAIRASLSVLLAALLAGCQDRTIGTIKADRQVIDYLNRDTSDQPKKVVPAGKARPRVNTNDLSPKFRGGERKP